MDLIDIFGVNIIRKMWDVGKPSLFRAGRNNDARGFSPLLPIGKKEKLGLNIHSK
jgi:hypothetical protein